MSDQSSSHPLWGTFALTLRRPREGAEQILSYGFSTQAVWMAFALSIVASAMLQIALELLNPTPTDNPFMGLANSPLTFAAIMGGAQLAFIFAIVKCGSPLGGKGTFDEGLLLFTWLQYISLAISLIVAVAVSLSPAFGLLIYFSFGYSAWLIVSFTTVLHRFSSVAMSIFALILAIVGLGLVMTFIATLFGITPA